MKERFLKVLIYLGLAWLIFFAFRLAIYIKYMDMFSVLDAHAVFLSFFTGFRVDVITVLTFCGLYILLMLFPVSWTNNTRYQASLSALFYLTLVLMVAALYGDYLYFEEVSRHTTSEIFYLDGGDASVVLEPLKAHWKGVLLILASYVLLFFVFRFVDTRFRGNVYFNGKNLSFFMLVFIVMFAGIRGKIIDKPFGIVDAFSTTHAESGHLALNGIYSVYRSSARDGKSQRFMKDEEAVHITRAILQDDNFSFVDDAYPLVRRLSEDKLERPDFPQLKNANVIIVLLEGWGSLFVDAYSNSSFGVTPNFDRLTQSGIKYTNFFANGQRSIDGITALFSGIPRLTGMNRLGSGLEVSNIALIGDIAQQNGYHTIAMQSSKRSSFRIDSVSRLAGFSEYYGDEDIPELGLETSGKEPHFGTWDNNTFQFLLQRLNQISGGGETGELVDKPFFAFAFSSTTHVPYISPGPEWEKYPHNDHDIFGFLNTLYYADEALGRFMQMAEQQSWYDNTVFIFMADHTVGIHDKAFDKHFDVALRPLEHMRVPLLVYAPKLLGSGVDERPTSQADIMPTLVHLMSWRGDFSSLSNSLFSPGPRFALLDQGPVISYVKETGYLRHNLDKVLENTFGEDKPARELLAVYQAMTGLLKNNRFYREIKKRQIVLESSVK